MNGYEKIASLLQERDNDSNQRIFKGVIESLPDIKVRINEKTVLGAAELCSLVNILETVTVDEETKYIWLERRVYLVPLEIRGASVEKYLILGGDEI